LLSTWTPRLIEPVRWLIIIGIAATLAQTVLFVISGPDSTPAEATPARKAAQPQRQATSINAVLSRNLFGIANTKAEASNTAPTVETRLPLELRGVFVGDDAASSAAIVAQKGKAGELYVVGGILPGNAELMEVHPDHIVLRRAGNLESLTFPEEGSPLVANEASDGTSNAADDASAFEYFPDETEDEALDLAPTGTPTAARSPGARGPATPREFVDNYRQRLDADPEGALSELGIAPVSASGAQGYRLDNLAKSPYLSQTGLQPGDVVLSVNGSPVGNIQQDRQQINSILEQGSARLEVQRGTRRFFVTASLK
jgi:general secretion pathway protein C